MAYSRCQYHHASTTILDTAISAKASSISYLFSTRLSTRHFRPAPRQHRQPRLPTQQPQATREKVAVTKLKSLRLAATKVPFLLPSQQRQAPPRGCKRLPRLVTLCLA